ncbi:MAG: Crp/Fnr family transcriptional regulator [Rhizobiaceae bacterium]
MTKDQAARAAVWASQLSADELERAVRGVSERRYAKGTYICHRGDRLEYWTGIVTGLVKVSSIARSGKAITYAGFGAGGWFGEGTILKNEARKYDLVAIRETHLLLMNRTTFDWLYDNSVGFNRFLVQQLNERLAQFIAVTEYDRLLAPEARVARHLSWLCNPILNPDVHGRIEITQEELALLAGVSRPIVNRGLQTLQDSGLIAIEHGVLHVLNVAGLGSYGN